VPARPVDAFKGNLQNQTFVAEIFVFAHRPETVGRVIADVAIELRERRELLQRMDFEHR
jgi:hypothetical protein